MKFYTDKANQLSLKIIIASIITGVQLDLVNVDLEARENRTPEFLEKSPLGKVPVLEVDAKTSLFEPNVICRFLASKQKKVTLFPSGTDGFLVEQWLEWEESRLIPDTYHYFASLSGVSDFPEEKVAASAAKTNEYLSYLESNINGKYLVGGALSMADIAIWSSLYIAFGKDGLLTTGDQAAKTSQQYPKITAWFNDLAQEKHFISALKKASVDSAADVVTSFAGRSVYFSDEGSRTYRLSPKTEKPVYITTPIYYVNGEPHIGHVYTTLLADVLARWYRIRGQDVFMMTGTDEHGQKVAQSAAAKGLSPKEFADQISSTFRNMFDNMNFKYDHFIRTTDPEHKVAVHEMWKRLNDKGFIYLGHHEGWYCVSDETFYTELQIEEVVRDGKTIKVSKESGHPVEWVREENYKFKLSEFQKPLLEWLQKNPNVILPRFRQKEIENFIRGGLNDLSISRTNSKWGIPVPQGDNNQAQGEHVIYVWLDALTNYLTGANFPQSPDGSPRWPADYHVIGKDILKFHAVYWPAFLLAAGLPLPKRIVAHGWWTKDGKKISKSLGNAFDPAETAKEFSLDALRYFLCRESNIGIDGDYTDANMISRLNSDLANDLGNLVLRCVSEALNPERKVPQCGELQEIDRKLIEQIERLPGWVDHHLKLMDTQGALTGIWEVIQETNKYVTTTAPWVLKKNDPHGRLPTVLYVMIEIMRIVALTITPFMPATAESILNQLGVPAELRQGDESFAFGLLKAGTPIPSDKVILFQKREAPKQQPEPKQQKAGGKQQAKQPKQDKKQQQQEANNNNNNANAQQ